MTFGIYLYAAYISFLPILSAVGLLIVVISLFKKDSKWKIAFQILSFCFIAAITTRVIFIFLENRNRQGRDEVISAIYQYHQRKGKFPATLGELPKPITSPRFNYIPNSTFTNFKLHSRDLYGIPRMFTSKDSLWEY